MVDLAVAPGWESRAAIGWGNPGRPAPAVHVPACTAGTAPWLAFAGGYWVDKPVCVPLEVGARGQHAEVHIGVGTPCPSAAG
ncbi:MAG: hypothetical protein M3024_00360 [Candidatus Dormibacteraeota bacterium]|nr:hypothetical protein [Candidatus Dormibacteraeota bacterium]